MPSERRQLLFPSSEVVEAVREYNRRLGKPLSAGTVTHAGIEPGIGGTIRFRISIAPVDTKQAGDSRQGGKAAAHETVIEDSALVAALILYCRDRRIPISAQAEKGLLKSGDQVCLMLTINPK